jgi:hypothetical protein
MSKKDLLQRSKYKNNFNDIISLSNLEEYSLKVLFIQ